MKFDNAKMVIIFQPFLLEFCFLLFLSYHKVYIKSKVIIGRKKTGQKRACLLQILGYYNKLTKKSIIINTTKVPSSNSKANNSARRLLGTKCAVRSMRNATPKKAFTFSCSSKNNFNLCLNFTFRNNFVFILKTP